MPDPEPAQPKRLSPWLSMELRRALDARDVRKVFALIGDYLEYHDLRMPAETLADYQERGIVEDERPN